MEGEDAVTLDDVVLWVKSELGESYESTRHAARMNIAGFTFLIVSLIAAVSWSDWRVGVMGVIGVLAALFFLWMVGKSQSVNWKLVVALRGVWLGILFGKIRTAKAARKMILKRMPHVAVELKAYERVVDEED